MNTRTYAVVMASVTELVTTILIFIFAGRWLDRHYGWKGLGLVCGMLLGAVLAFVRLVVNLKKLEQSGEK